MADIYGTSSSETLFGTYWTNYWEDDYIDGMGGHDTVYGLGGNDILVGNFGSNDTLFGGLGADTFTLYTSNNVGIFPNGLNGYYDNQPFVCDYTTWTVHRLPDYSSADSSLAEGDAIALGNASLFNPITAQTFDANGNPIAYEIIYFSLPMLYDSIVGAKPYDFGIDSIDSSPIWTDLYTSNLSNINDWSSFANSYSTVSGDLTGLAWSYLGL